MNDKIILWLRRSIYTAVLVLLCVLIWLTVQVSLTLREVRQGMRTTVSDLQNDVNDLRQEIGDLGTGMLSLPETPAGNEIEYLLSKIGDSQLRYQYEGKSRPAAWVRAKLYAKYRLHPDVKTADDFIQQVASRTSQGDTYYVIEGDKTLELGPWLTKALEQLRQGSSKPQNEGTP